MAYYPGGPAYPGSGGNEAYPRQNPYDAYGANPTGVPPGRYPSGRLPNAAGVPNNDAYLRGYPPSGVPPPPPMMSSYPTSAYPAGLPGVYPAYPRQQAPPPPPIPQQQPYYPQIAPTLYQQQPMSTLGYAIPPTPPGNPYAQGQQVYGYPGAAMSPAMAYPASNPYDPYGNNNLQAALARSYQEGYEGRGRARHRGK
jgi:hypothetical protein